MYTKHRRVFRQRCWNDFEFRARKDSIMSVESCGSPQRRRLPWKQEHVSCHVFPLVLYFFLFSSVRRQHLVALALSKSFRARSLANYRSYYLYSREKEYKNRRTSFEMLRYDFPWNDHDWSKLFCGKNFSRNFWTKKAMIKNMINIIKYNNNQYLYYFYFYTYATSSIIIFSIS